MELIYVLYQQSEPCQEFFAKFLLPVLAELPDNSRRTSGRFMHVGLNNLGSTCYMNSMLQVLNTIDAFRNALMRTQSESPLVGQLQSLFSYLFFSERIDYVPRELLNAFEPPINPGLQQDTTEFLNYLCDQLERKLKETPYRRLLEELFQGSQVAQMICHACGGKRER
jgi:ubiquitin C-terminal hydrolase